jgi:peptide/nickel transport system permease protein
VFRYTLRRILVTIPILLIVTVIVFFVMQLLPGDPARMVLGQEATPHALEVMRERLGLNR